MAEKDEEKVVELKKAFKECDVGEDGLLDFDEFYVLLKRGNPSFAETQAETLYEHCDQDMSGMVDFDELVDFVFSKKSMERLFIVETTADEEECKQILLGKPATLRCAASKAVKARGGDWRNLSWRERLEELKELEKGETEGDPMSRTLGAPLKDPSSTIKAPKRKAERERQQASPKSPQKVQEGEEGKPGPRCGRRKSLLEKVPEAPSSLPLPQLSSRKGGASSIAKTGKFGIAEMGQAELVAYSLQEDDLSFAGRNISVKQELRTFREYLKTASSPLVDLDIIKFIAKGTAGWVFLCADKKDPQKRCALKLIRMTQARSGIKEWYCSKAMRNLKDANGEQNIVFTDEIVRVVKRGDSPEVIQEQLANAGPVEYYMSMMQELMPWGTLEDLAKEGELSPEVMFKCLEDVSATLTVMHENGMQHRDVKPENIMLQMDDEDTVVAAKLCDFGSAQMEGEESCWDDIRRFGVTLFSVATGEGWTANRLIREKHDVLVERLKEAVEGHSDPAMIELPGILEQILSRKLSMKEVAALISKLADYYDDD